MPYTPSSKVQVYLSDSISLTESKNLKPEKSLTDNLTITENKVLKVLFNLASESLSLTETNVTRKAGRTITDSITLSETLGKKVSQLLTDSLTITESFSSAEVAELAESIRNDFESRVDVVGEKISVTSIDETYDGMGNIISVAETGDNTVRAFITDINPVKDAEYLKHGIAKTGDCKLYAKWSYDLTGSGDDYVIKQGDIVTREDGYRYRVEKEMRNPVVDGLVVFRKYLIRRVQT